MNYYKLVAIGRDLVPHAIWLRQRAELDASHAKHMAHGAAQMLSAIKGWDEGDLVDVTVEPSTAEEYQTREARRVEDVLHVEEVVLPREQIAQWQGRLDALEIELVEDGVLTCPQQDLLEEIIAELQAGRCSR